MVFQKTLGTFKAKIKHMEIKRILHKYFEDSYLRTLFVIDAILGFLLLYMTVADRLSLFGQDIGGAIYNWLH